MAIPYILTQEYATKMYAEERARERERKAVVEIYQEFGIPFDEAIQKLAADFSLKIEEAEEYVREYWKN